MTTSGAGGDKRQSFTRPVIWLLLAGGVALLFLLDLALGSVRIPGSEVLKVLAFGEASQDSWTRIVLHFRLPKAVAALLAGGALAVSGLLMQTLFRNPLAGPFVLGISSGASLGVALVVLTTGASGASLLATLGVGEDLAVAAAASAGAGLALGLVLVTARRVSILALLILGMLFGYATGALVTVLLHFAMAERIQAYVVWTFGSFGVTWQELLVLAPLLLVGLVGSMALAKPLDALLLGEGHARALGVRVTAVRSIVLVATAVLAGSVTAFCGPIGFIGVAVPHLARGLWGTSAHRILLPASALLGAVVALAADLVAQLPGSSSVLPLNAVTALLGTPVIAWVVLRNRRFGASFS
ncbi:MAG: iron ABC transporter permease [Thermoanaerobaculia bacterium]|nr:iron ABC transporter permease [Thermoanaerobaculia bacterium]